MVSEAHEQEPLFTGFYGTRQKPSDYKVISCLLMDASNGDILSRGLAICAAGDTFDKEHGKAIAFGRAEQGWFAGRMNLPERPKTKLRRPEVINGLHDAGFWVPYEQQDGKTVPCLPTLMKYEPNLYNDIILTTREQLAVESWRRQHGFGAEAPQAKAM